MIPAQAPLGAGRGETPPYRFQRPLYYWVPWIVFGLLLAVFLGWTFLVAFRVVPLGGGFPYPVWPFFPFAFFFLFFLFFFVFRLAWWGYRRPWAYGGYRGGWRYSSNDAHAILRQRYARGEITAEQLRQMTRELDEVDRR